jgi:hypothetical protein
MARENRQFLGRAVNYVAACGVRQFIDIGAGLPTAVNTHDIAQEYGPGAAVAYVENDPVVISPAAERRQRRAGVISLPRFCRSSAREAGYRAARRRPRCTKRRRTFLQPRHRLTNVRSPRRRHWKGGHWGW